MRIDDHISELLFEHDCVIVPEFGGFIGNYSPAKVDEVKHLFEPPKKKILFNKGLTQNDGLLANHLSIKEQVTYTEALRQIAKEVDHYRTELKNNKRVVFENIGMLYTDESNNLVFQPDEKTNYLPEAFGLSAFYRLPVATEKVEEKSVVVQMHKERNRLRPYAVAAAVGALIASTFWFTLNETNIANNLSGLNIFGKKEARIYVSTVNDNLDKLNASVPKDTLTLFIKEQHQQIKADITSSPYHIVAGCFMYYENAQKMVGVLQKKNVEAAILGKNNQGLYIVGCGKYSSYADAEAHLDSFRPQCATRGMGLF